MGKIARTRHLPAICGNPAFRLVASVDPGQGIDGVRNHPDLEALFAREGAIDAVALCTPPQVRHDLAVQAISRGTHVLLEKPPGCTLSELADLERRAGLAGTSLFAAWHSRFAAGVAPARAWLAVRQVRAARIVWREDVRVWHPGQDWIWQPGGMGVFDPGVNALSIATHILPRALHLVDAVLRVPGNRAGPIAATLALRDELGANIEMDLDWRQTGPQNWDIEVETDAGMLALSRGGAVLALPGETRRDEDREYPRLYARFADLIHAGASEMDIRPLGLVADAFLRGRREIVEDFHDGEPVRQG